MSLKDCIQRDIFNVYMKVDEYCDALTIQIGTTKFDVIGSLQSNSVQNTSGNGQPLQDTAWTLYLPYPLVTSQGNLIARSLLSSGTRITIDGKPYSVISVSDEMGVATIQLHSKTGR